MEVRELFRSKPAPRPVKADLVYHPPILSKSPEFWTVRIYLADYMTFSGEDQLAIKRWLQDVVDECRKSGKRVYKEVWPQEGVPPA